MAIFEPFRIYTHCEIEDMRSQIREANIYDAMDFWSRLEPRGWNSTPELIFAFRPTQFQKMKKWVRDHLITLQLVTPQGGELTLAEFDHEVGSLTLQNEGECIHKGKHTLLK